MTTKRWHRLLAATAFATLVTSSPTFAAGNLLQVFGAPGVPAAPWRLALLPQQKKPVTQFKVVDEGGARALRVEAESSYGNLLHSLPEGTAAVKLSWRWKVELLNTEADLHTKEGDDTTLKVCTLWDEPLDKVPFAERQVLRLARLAAGEPLPAATVCYVWDAKLADGTELDSAFTHRLRYVVLRHGAGPGAGWAGEKRDIAADFLRLFGREVSQLPPLVGIAVGADADNTHSHSIGYVADLVLEP